MGNKLKVTVTIEESIVREIDRASNERGESRSRVIETAIQQWRKRELDKQLSEGYRRRMWKQPKPILRPVWRP